LWEAMGRPEFAEDPRFAKAMDRVANRDALTAEIEEWMQSFGSDVEVVDALEACRVPCGPVLKPAEAASHPFFVERRAVRSVDDPLTGPIDVPGFPIKFSDAPPEPDLITHALGQDNHEVLHSLLGYDDARIAKLTEDGVIASKQH